ncbi:MAG: secondary thiamine-phosphate synthase enzyme YjbQ [Hydrogenothermaceae bacterium]|nr:secondary thiamine-phosphate synthase enzyme YjbQ [Hydrogenothermaceae bacterium]
MFKTFSIRTNYRTDLIEITDTVYGFLKECKVQEGICVVYVPHTTAGLFINENADPDVVFDVKNFLERLVPWVGDYRHTEGNASAHIKSILTGNSLTIPIQNGRLSLGRWQGIFFAEFDGPRERKFYIKVLKG